MNTLVTGAKGFAGNRCKDKCLPEEANRRSVDIRYSAHARRYLADNGLPKEPPASPAAPWPRCLTALSKIEGSDIYARLGLEKGKYILLSTAVDMNKNRGYGTPVPDYIEQNVSDKVVKIIQSYAGVIDKMVWRKY